MKKLILVLICFLGFSTLSANEQVIIIKTTGGVERPALTKGGEPYIGFNNVSLKLSDDGKITLSCSDAGWEPCELNLPPNKVKCESEDLLKAAFAKIKKGELNGSLSDEIKKGKKKFKRTIKWSSTGITKTSTIKIILKDE